MLAALVLACVHPVPPAPVVAPTPSPDLLAVAWQQTSAEYAATARTVYQAALPALDRALADPTWTAATEQLGAEAATLATLPCAIVVDVDETVLDNSPYQVRNLRDGAGFDKATWGAWVAEAEAEPVPGAAAFLSAAREKGVAVYYLSNRDASQAEATRANLAAQGFPDAEDLDTFLFRPDGGPSAKSPRRTQVAATHRVVLMFGDNLFDFVESERPDLAARDALVAQYGDWWGTRWFALPNPMYGSWDEALQGYERGLPPEEQLRRRLAPLHDGR